MTLFKKYISSTLPLAIWSVTCFIILYEYMNINNFTDILKQDYFDSVIVIYMSLIFIKLLSISSSNQYRKCDNNSLANQFLETKFNYKRKRHHSHVT